jgi:hypothetical protein
MKAKKPRILCALCQAASENECSQAPSHVVHPLSGKLGLYDIYSNAKCPECGALGIVEGIRRCWLTRSAMEDITVEELEMQIQRAAQCASVTLPADELTPLLDLALRAAGIYNSETIKQLREISGEAEITITGDEFRLILDLALRAKRNPRLKVMPPWDKKG